MAETKDFGDGVGWIRGQMLGKGSFGCVFMATPRNPCSFPPPEMAVKSAPVQFSDTLRSEREIMSDLKGCPNLIQCLGQETTVGNDALFYNLMLEFAAGGTLSDRIQSSGGGLPEPEVRAHTRSILMGLDHIHSHGYVHCDLKPDNILLVPDGQNGFTAKISDFGLAKREPKRAGRKRAAAGPGKWQGTPMYLPPEAVTEGLQEAAGDVWAVGCVVVEMLTGRPLWEPGSKEEILRSIGEDWEYLRIPEWISDEAADFLMCCLEKEPSGRVRTDLLLYHPFVEGSFETGDCGSGVGGFSEDYYSSCARLGVVEGCVGPGNEDVGRGPPGFAVAV
ncbi:mitogen-activated protein kinase kinase kinase [Striga asiatica]|uniref:Mitogen-activated protein kinase kinase kinase n=1 Tax=Striga asiatica TaxID=4170 RepID=A0A5A7R292_STRAF|nr:mitogen-activated protein kinase kinase kinase [Striga asiatica]